MAIFLTLIEHHRYSILFFVNLLELIALPISGEVTMSYTGYLIYQGKLNYFISIFLAVFGAIMGITTSYLIGYKYGFRLVLKYGKYIHFGPEKYEKTAKWFDRHGNKLLIFSYFLPGIRHFTGYFAGISKLPFGIFARNAYIGAFIWGFTFITLGKTLGPQWEKFHHAASKYLGIGIAGLAFVLLSFLLIRKNKAHLKSMISYYISLLAGFFSSLKGLEIFIICLFVLFLMLFTIALGFSAEYFLNALVEFNEVGIYLISTLFNKDWLPIMNSFLLLQTPGFLFIFLIGTISVLFLNKRNLLLELLFTVITIIGGKIFKDVLLKLIYYVKAHVGSLFLKVPNEQSFMAVIIYGFFVYMLVRHLNKQIQKSHVILPVLMIILLLIMGVANVYVSICLPSEVLAGYVFGATWLCLNVMLLEITRLIHKKL